MSSSFKGKIINDPIYGFIHFQEKEMMTLLEHRWFQRLRNIRQMGTATFVYPGATHSRFQHSLGTAHLMETALNILRKKGVEITEDESLAARQAILLHDIGHGPYSHALEFSLIPDIQHEEISLLLMKALNQEFGGKLDLAIQIFQNKYHKPFLHQLVSSQLDMDRMDFLNRDSFYTGVSEGVIGYHRILQMLAVHKGDLVVEEKGIHSVEKFIIARRLMYWQVYLHKTVLASEQLLIKTLTRAKELAQKGISIFAAPDLTFFLFEKVKGADLKNEPKLLERYCRLIDADILSAVNNWQGHSDPVLSQLAQMLINRHLFKVKLSLHPLPDSFMEEKAKKASQLYPTENIPYYLFSGKTSNSTYKQNDEQINILMKTGELVNISNVENSLINNTVSGSIEKYFYCWAPQLE